MKTAGDILSALFDESFVKKAQGYSNLFNSWADITQKNGIAAAAAHSRIKKLDRGILLVEMDHPGWKQILQTKQSKLLIDFRIRFPDLDISGMSLMLGKSDSGNSVNESHEDVNPEVNNNPTESRIPQSIENNEQVAASIDSIKDDVLREKLIKLGQVVARR